MRQSAFILGSRGSVPISERLAARYGGLTTCIFLRLADQPVILDAGTGLLNLTEALRDGEQDLPLLLSHPHIDHLLGLPMCPAVFNTRRTFHIYSKTRNGMDAKAQLSALMSPPLWPVGPEALPARFAFHDLPDVFDLGPIHVETMEGVHPGGVTLFRLTGGGKRVVFATDCTLTDGLLPKLTEFARDCDLLLCDGQYSDAEWPARSDFGHSTWTAAARLGQLCGAKQVRIIHHDPGRTDAELDTAAGELDAIHPQCAFARAGEEVIL